MTPNELVPGIKAYPDLEARLQSRINRAGCCEFSTIADIYRKKLAERQKRDKVLGRG